MANLYVSSFGSDPETVDYMVWIPFGVCLLVSLVVGVLMRKKKDSTYVRYQGLVWSMLCPLLTLTLSMTVPELFGRQFGAVTALISMICGIGADRVFSWSGSPLLGLLACFASQGASIGLISYTHTKCPPAPKDDDKTALLGALALPPTALPATALQATALQATAPVHPLPQPVQYVQQPVQYVQVPAMQPAPIPAIPQVRYQYVQVPMPPQETVPIYASQIQGLPQIPS